MHAEMLKQLRLKQLRLKCAEVMSMQTIKIVHYLQFHIRITCLFALLNLQFIFLIILGKNFIGFTPNKSQNISKSV